MLAAMATVGWSLSGAFVRHLPGLTGWQINCWRGLFMALALLLWLTVRYRSQLPARVAEVPKVALIAAGSFFALGSTLYVTALTMASTANVACLTATAPIFTAMLSRAFNGENPSKATWLASFMALGGVAFIVRDGMQAGNLAGNLVALSCALCWALQVNTLRRYRNVDMVPAMVLGGIGVFLVAGFWGGGFDVTSREMAILAIMGMVQLAVPIVLFARSARSVPAVVASLIVLLDTVLNPFWSYLTAGEKAAPQDFIGGAVIVSAVMISVLYGRRSAQVNAQARARHGAV
jgi:drug/metabolite transporter (DMT)-like permease